MKAQQIRFSATDNRSGIISIGITDRGEVGVSHLISTATENQDIADRRRPHLGHRPMKPGSDMGRFAGIFRFKLHVPEDKLESPQGFGFRMDLWKDGHCRYMEIFRLAAGPFEMRARTKRSAILDARSKTPVINLNGFKDTRTLGGGHRGMFGGLCGNYSDSPRVRFCQFC